MLTCRLQSSPQFGSGREPSGSDGVSKRESARPIVSALWRRTEGENAPWAPKPLPPRGDSLWLAGSLRVLRREAQVSTRHTHHAFTHHIHTFPAPVSHVALPSNSYRISERALRPRKSKNFPFWSWVPAAALAPSKYAMQGAVLELAWKKAAAALPVTVLGRNVIWRSCRLRLITIVPSGPQHPLC